MGGSGVGPRVQVEVPCKHTQAWVNLKHNESNMIPSTNDTQTKPKHIENRGLPLARFPSYRAGIGSEPSTWFLPEGRVEHSCIELQAFALNFTPDT